MRYLKILKIDVTDLESWEKVIHGRPIPIMFYV